MAILVNRICKLCGVKTWEEDGFIQCDCIMVDKEDWAHGVTETPKEWIDEPPFPSEEHDSSERAFDNFYHPDNHGYPTVADHINRLARDIGKEEG